MKSNSKLFIAILAGLVLGVVLGLVVYYQYPKETAADFAKNIKLLGTIFIRMVQMIIAPLVFSTLVVGIAKMGDMKMVGRVGGKAMAWFISASLMSLLLGMVLVNWLKPGESTAVSMADVKPADDLVSNVHAFSLEQFVTHVVPKSIFEAMATNEILQIVIFSILFGIALASMGKAAESIIKVLDTIAHAVLKMVSYVMWVAPLGVFGAVSAAVAIYGGGIWKLYASYLAAFAFGILCLWIILLGVGYLILGNRLWLLLKRLAGPLLIAFSTTSSEAVFPKLTEELERFGCDPKIVSFTLPLGYSFNLDGSMMYMTFASLFIAQIYGIDMPIEKQVLMLLVLAMVDIRYSILPESIITDSRLSFRTAVYLTFRVCMALPKKYSLQTGTVADHTGIKTILRPRKPIRNLTLSTTLISGTRQYS